MIEVDVGADYGELTELVKKYPLTVAKLLDLFALALKGDMQQEAPTRSGALRGSIGNPQKTGTLDRSILIGAVYWSFVQFGTGTYGPGGSAYDIYPVAKQCLKFEVNGETVFAKYIKDHPGMKANPFIDRAIETTSPKAPDILQGLLNKVTQ